MTWAEQMQAWSEACQRATAGPWTVMRADDGDWMIEGTFDVIDRGYVADMCDDSDTSKDDAEFIAMCRELVPEAIERIRELEAALSKAADDMEGIIAYVPEYFQDKWDMAEDIKAARVALAGKP